ALLHSAGHAPLPAGAQRLLAVPRPGTISPWSSKATDIARACGLDAVERIERGTWYALGAAPQLPPDVLLRAGRVLIDPMTEALLTDSGQARALFETQEPAPLERIPLAAEGRDALLSANAALALALSDDEIDYLHDSYRRLGRDPSD